MSDRRPGVSTHTILYYSRPFTLDPLRARTNHPMSLGEENKEKKSRGGRQQQKEKRINNRPAASLPREPRFNFSLSCAGRACKSERRITNEPSTFWVRKGFIFCNSCVCVCASTPVKDGERRCAGALRWRVNPRRRGEREDAAVVGGRLGEREKKRNEREFWRMARWAASVVFSSLFSVGKRLW